MDKYTFEQLPEAVSLLIQKVESLEKIIVNQQKVSKELPDQWLDLNELCEYLPDKPAKGTAYGWVHHSLIPYHKKSKKLSFLKSEIDLWIKSGRRKTLSELSELATNHLKAK